MSDLYHFIGGYSSENGEVRRQDGGAVPLRNVRCAIKGPWSDAWQDWSVVLVFKGGGRLNLELVHYEDFIEVWQTWLDKHPDLDVKS